MGACNFSTKSSGKDVSEAFANAVENARYYEGHGGYTGTIAEKDEYRIVKLPEGIEPNSKFFEAWIDINTDEQFGDKWGPCGAVKIGDDGKQQEWCFFGWASS